MNKKLLALSLGIMTAVSTSAFAAPATDLSAGKVAIDLSVTKPDLETKALGLDVSPSSKTNLDFGITAGLGNKWGIQYKQQQGDTDSSLKSIFNFKAEGKVQEFNVVYQIDKNFQAFIGMNKLSGTLYVTPTGSSVTTPFDIDYSSKWQVGVTGVTKLGNKLSGWATLAAGSDNYTYELGLAQELSKQWDLNLFYRYKKFSNIKLQVLGGPEDLTVSTLGLGVTAKF